MVQLKWSERTAEQVFGQGRLVKWLKSIFATKNHTHTKSEITDFPHTHTLSEISDLTDTGWVDVIFNNNATHWDTDNHLKIRKYGKMVVLTGLAKMNTNLGGANDVEIATLDANYRPTVPVHSSFIAYLKYGFITIGTDGKLTVRNRSNSQIDAGQYIEINATYFIS